MGAISSGTWNGTTIAINHGGTGQTTAAAAFNALAPATSTGGLIYGSASNTYSNLGIGSTGNVLTVSGGLPVWAAPATSGTVTSVALSTPGVLYTVSGSPVTTAGTLTLTLNTQSANTVFAGPASGGATTPGFRSLVSADIPNNAANTTGTASNVTTSTFTQGSIIFANSSGQLAQDNAAFFWNDTNQSIGIGTASPASTTFIDGVNSTGATKRFVLTGYGTSSFVGTRGRFARGTVGSPAAVQSGDILNFLSGQGYGASQFPSGSTAAINIVAGETFTNSSNATYMTFSTTPTASVTIAEAMRVNSTGNILIGTTTDSGTQKLQVNGNSNVGTVTGGIWTGTGTRYYTFLTSGTSVTLPSTNFSTNTSCTFTLVGGGGGGGGTSSTINQVAAGGGAACALKLIATGISAGTTISYTIGSGGAGNSDAAGSNGTNSTLIVGATTYTAGFGTWWQSSRRRRF